MRVQVSPRAIKDFMKKSIKKNTKYLTEFWKRKYIKDSYIHKRINDFLKNITILKYDRCWIWKKGLTYDGYGVFYLGKKQIRCHIFSFRLFRGKIPKCFLVCHTCDNRKCCNPNHLFLGKDVDNVRDMMFKGRHSSITHPEKIPKGENHCHAKLNNEKVLKIRKWFSSKKYTVREMSKIFKVGKRTIKDVIDRLTWKHL